MIQLFEFTNPKVITFDSYSHHSITVPSVNTSFFTNNGQATHITQAPLKYNLSFLNSLFLVTLHTTYIVNYSHFNSSPNPYSMSHSFCIIQHLLTFFQKNMYNLNVTRIDAVFENLDENEQSQL